MSTYKHSLCLIPPPPYLSSRLWEWMNAICTSLTSCRTTGVWSHRQTPGTEQRQKRDACNHGDAVASKSQVNRARVGSDASSCHLCLPRELRCNWAWPTMLRLSLSFSRPLTLLKESESFHEIDFVYWANVQLCSNKLLRTWWHLSYTGNIIWSKV